MLSRLFAKPVIGNRGGLTMEAIGFIFGLAGLAYAIMATNRLNKLEEKLKELGVLDKDFKSGEK